MSGTVLVVCAKNVCRSPTAAAVLRSELGDGAWCVRSSGACALAKAELCATARDVLGDLAPATHRSRQLNLADITAAQLILVATREERGRVARLSPAARTKTFTLKEAALLGAELFAGAHTTVGEGVAHPAGALAHYAKAVGAQRGLVTPPTAARRWLRPSSEHPFDLPDAHGSAARWHVRRLQETADVARVVAGQIRSADRPLPTPEQTG